MAGLESLMASVASLGFQLEKLYHEGWRGHGILHLSQEQGIFYVSPSIPSQHEPTPHSHRTVPCSTLRLFYAVHFN
jgi:hypothetical protein